jgi:DNA-binding HxlR family transcriptional regulator
MATDRLIIRTDYTGKVPRVEYSLANPLGYAVLDLLQAVAEWGDRHCRQIKGREIKDDEMSLASRD